MRDFLGIDKALQSIHGELLNSTSKLTERIKNDTKKLEEVENNPTDTDEQRQLHRDRLDDLNAEKRKARNPVTESKRSSITSRKD